MKKPISILLTIILVLCLFAGCEVSNPSNPTPQKTPAPPPSPTLEVTPTPTPAPPSGGGIVVVLPPSVTPTENTWDGTTDLSGNGTYYVTDISPPTDDGASLVTLPNFSGKLIFDKDYGNITFAVPNATVEITGTVGNLSGVTGKNTLMISSGAKAKNITLSGGNLILNGTIGNLTIPAGATVDNVKIDSGAKANDITLSGGNLILKGSIGNLTIPADSTVNNVEIDGATMKDMAVSMPIALSVKSSTLANLTIDAPPPTESGTPVKTMTVDLAGSSLSSLSIQSPVEAKISNATVSSISVGEGAVTEGKSTTIALSDSTAKITNDSKTAGENTVQISASGTSDLAIENGATGTMNVRVEESETGGSQIAIDNKNEAPEAAIEIKNPAGESLTANNIEKFGTQNPNTILVSDLTSEHNPKEFFYNGLKYSLTFAEEKTLNKAITEANASDTLNSILILSDQTLSQVAVTKNLTIDGFGRKITLKTSLTISEGVITTVKSGTLTTDVNFELTGTLENLGIIATASNFYNNGTIQNIGTITTGGNFTNNGTIQNIGTITSGGNFNNFGTLTNTGTFTSTSNFKNYSTVTSSGTFTSKSNFYNYAADTLNNNAPGTVENTGTFATRSNFYNHGEIQNEGTFANGGTFTNLAPGTFTNEGILTNKSYFTNNGTFTNSGTFTNDYKFTNSGTFDTSNGTFVNNEEYEIIVEVTAANFASEIEKAHAEVTRLKLTEDITLEDYGLKVKGTGTDANHLKIPETSHVILDLNGHNLTFTNDTENENDYMGDSLVNYGALQITDSSSGGTKGTIKNQGSLNGKAYMYTGIIRNQGAMTISRVTMESEITALVRNQNLEGSDNDVEIVGKPFANLRIESGNFKVTGGNSGGWTNNKVAINSKGNLTINGGTFVSGTEGATTAADKLEKSLIFMGAEGAVATINGGTFTCHNYGSEIELEGGSVSIVKGTFKHDVSSYIAFGSVLTKDGNYIVKSENSKIEVSTLEGLKGIGSGNAVVVIAGNIEIPAGNTITLTDGQHLKINEGATLTVNGTLSLPGQLSNQGEIIFGENSQLFGTQLTETKYYGNLMTHTVYSNQSPHQVFEVSTPQALFWASYLHNTDPNCNIETINISSNLNMTNVAYQPLGTIKKPFTGTIQSSDSTQKTISNLTVKGRTYTGLVGIGENFTVKNLTIDSSSFEVSSGRMGAFVAQILGTANLENLVVGEKTTLLGTTTFYGGGIAGSVYLDAGETANFKNCDFNGSITSKYNVGSMFGTASGSLGTINITNCSFNGAVKAIGGSVGLIGGFLPGNNDCVINVTDFAKGSGATVLLNEVPVTGLFAGTGTVNYYAVSETVISNMLALTASVTLNEGVTLTGNTTIPAGKTLVIPEGKTLTVSESATLTVEGTLTNNGTIVNNGNIFKQGGTITNFGTVSGFSPGTPIFVTTWEEHSAAIAKIEEGDASENYIVIMVGDFAS